MPEPAVAVAAPYRAPINWLAAIVLTVTPILAVILVPWHIATHGLNIGLIVGFLAFWTCNGMAITTGYHRLWAHSTYKAHPAFKWVLALMGAAATQNSILVWATGHRRHHRHVDDNEHDPYSAKRGFWFSHIGWMLRKYPSGEPDFSNGLDLQRDPVVMFQHKYYLPLTIAMNFGPAILVGWLCGDILGGIIWVGILRLVVSHHLTFFINSLAHIWGKRPYTDSNTARDNGILALVTWGEGYHNYHHIFAQDYRNGVRWYQFDPSKWLIFLGSKLGFTSQLSRTDSFKIQRALLDMQFKDAKTHLASKGNPEKWRAALEHEYQQFASCLHEWNTVREQWFEHKRQQLAQKAADLHTALHTRLKELERALREQRRRVRMLTLQFA
jgi:stearoyl-CoA desaturase (Delta-9 desaturase)